MKNVFRIRDDSLSITVNISSDLVRGSWHSPYHVLIDFSLFIDMLQVTSHTNRKQMFHTK